MLRQTQAYTKFLALILTLTFGHSAMASFPQNLDPELQTILSRYSRADDELAAITEKKDFEFVKSAITVYFHPYYDRAIFRRSLSGLISLQLQLAEPAELLIYEDILIGGIRTRPGDLGNSTAYADVFFALRFLKEIAVSAGGIEKLTLIKNDALSRRRDGTSLVDKRIDEIVSDIDIISGN